MNSPKSPHSSLIAIPFLVFLAGCGAGSITPAALPNFPPTATSTPVAAPATPQPAPSPTTAPTPTIPSEPLEFVWRITGDPNPLSRPIGVAVDAEGNVYVMDAGNSRVQKFDQNGRFLLMWGSNGNANGQFNIKMPDEGSVAVDAEGNVYVGDNDNYRVEKFDRNGRYLAQWGTRGYADGQFAEIADIAIDNQNNVYVSDYLNGTIQKFDGNGRFLLGWGSRGSLEGKFNGAGSIVFDSQGNVLVAEVETGRLQKFDSNGRFLSKSYLPSVTDKPIVPYAIAMDRQGNIYISDNPSHRIVKIDSDMNILAVWGSEGKGAGQFNDMHTIRVDDHGYIYVSDSANNCVQKFRQPAFLP
jgi:tripartite motif-containing protein 71